MQSLLYRLTKHRTGSRPRPHTVVALPHPSRLETRVATWAGALVAALHAGAYSAASAVLLAARAADRAKTILGCDQLSPTQLSLSFATSW